MTDRVGNFTRARARSVPLAAWVVLVTLVALALYLASRSASLDDFDSYSFAQALDRFDIALQQPQPPGFPVYVAAGRVANALLSGPRLALTTLSALGGALAVGLTAVIGWQLFRRRDVALASALILALSPIHWLASGKALSDAPGLAMALVALAALWAGRTNRRWLVIGAGLLGLSLGVRPQTNLPGACLAVWLAWDVLRVPAAVRRDAWRNLALAVIVGVAAVLIWLVPVAQSSGGLDDYLDLVDAHSTHVWESDSLFGQGPVTGAALRARVKDTLETVLVPTLGISVYESFSTIDALRVAVLALVVVGGVVFSDYRRVENRWLALWFLLVFVPYFLLESLNRPRLLLPALPPLILLAVGGWMRLADRLPWWARSVRWLAVGCAAFALLLEAVPLVSTLAREPAPPAQAAAYLRATYPAGETLVVAAGSFRAAQVELPDYPMAYLYQFDADSVTAAIASGAYRYVAILDREQFSPEVIAVLGGDGRYVPVDDRLFVRDARVHWQHSQVRLQVLMPADQLDAARLSLPPGGRIDLGATDDGRFVGQGWFRSETVGDVVARWADGSTISDLRVSLEPGIAYTVTFRAAAYPADQRVTVAVDGRVLAEFEMPADWRDYTFTLPSDLSGPSGTGPAITTLTFTHAQAESPYTRTSGGSSDQRALAAAYTWLEFVPVE